MITRLEASKNPLYLKIMLFYLIHFGNFARLREYIVSFAIPYSDSLLSDAFKILLERLEEEYGEVFRYMFFILEINSAISPKYIINKIMKISDLDYHEANKVKLILMQLNEFIRVNEYGCNILHESLQKTMKDMYGG